MPSFFNLGKAVTLAISPSLILAFSYFSIPKNPASNLLTFNELNTRISRLGNLPNGGKTSAFSPKSSLSSCNLVNVIIQFGKSNPP
ncbi:hypothetical protein NC651_029180 [Populus alba x Populus x berolinensis]|nr:hypothetical protein NC651_029180 [Populus alba x Populus x berolinensis]